MSPSAPAGSRQLATAVAPSADANSDDDEQPVGAGFATLTVGGSLAVFILLVGDRRLLAHRSGLETRSIRTRARRSPTGRTPAERTGSRTPRQRPRPTFIPPHRRRSLRKSKPPATPPTPMVAPQAVEKPADVAKHADPVALTPKSTAPESKTSNPATPLGSDPGVAVKTPADKKPEAEGPTDKKPADKPLGTDGTIAKSEPKAPTKFPIPDDAALAQSAEKQFTEQGEVRDAADLFGLVKHLDPPARIYVVLYKSVEAAVASGDVATATKAIDELDARFVLNVLPLRVKTLDALRQHVSASARLARDRQCGGMGLP